MLYGYTCMCVFVPSVLSVLSHSVALHLHLRSKMLPVSCPPLPFLMGVCLAQIPVRPPEQFLEWQLRC